MHDARGEVDWRITRSEQGAQLWVRDESTPLPAYVRELIDEAGFIQGIPQGQIQPKHKL